MNTWLLIFVYLATFFLWNNYFSINEQVDFSILEPIEYHFNVGLYSVASIIFLI